MRLLNREDRPERGAVWVAGRNIIDMPPSRVPHLRRNIGVVFQDFKLIPQRNLMENVGLALEVIGAPRDEIKRKVTAVLSVVGLQEPRIEYPEMLSGGEQQRVRWRGPS